ncbi:MAG: hypothetical protein KGJ78_10360 [Alphaproteobacteria bacterium]|nr:hypothetical protein [Alphaproteobacteria bacterium]
MAAFVIASPTASFACACGCGVFEIGNLFTDQPGGAAFLEYDFMDQSKNWSGPSRAPATNNDDKDIRTSFYTLGAQYLFASGFGVMAEVPYWSRHFATTGSSSLMSFDHSALGDIRLTGAYSGFSEDRDTGVTFGVKLPSGDFAYPNFDRDTEIGSGSTDITVGAYHRGSLDAMGNWRYFAQARYQAAVLQHGGYRPGDELNGTAGVSYDTGRIGGIELSPLFQVLGSTRRHDSGPEAKLTDSGYSRIILAPGVDFGIDSWIVHAEVDFPVYQNVIGNQLVASTLFKSSIAYAF